jgi:hypothetical protein
MKEAVTQAVAAAQAAWEQDKKKLLASQNQDLLTQESALRQEFAVEIHRQQSITMEAHDARFAANLAAAVAEAEARAQTEAQKREAALRDEFAMNLEIAVAEARRQASQNAEEREAQLREELAAASEAAVKDAHTLWLSDAASREAAFRAECTAAAESTLQKSQETWVAQRRALTTEHADSLAQLEASVQTTIRAQRESAEAATAAAVQEAIAHAKKEFESQLQASLAAAADERAVLAAAAAHGEQELREGLATALTALAEEQTRVAAVMAQLASERDAIAEELRVARESATMHVDTVEAVGQRVEALQLELAAAQKALAEGEARWLHDSEEATLALEAMSAERDRAVEATEAAEAALATMEAERDRARAAAGASAAEIQIQLDAALRDVAELRAEQLQLKEALRTATDGQKDAAAARDLAESQRDQFCDDLEIASTERNLAQNTLASERMAAAATAAALSVQLETLTEACEKHRIEAARLKELLAEQARQLLSMATERDAALLASTEAHATATALQDTNELESRQHADLLAAAEEQRKLFKTAAEQSSEQVLKLQQELAQVLLNHEAELSAARQDRNAALHAAQVAHASAGSSNERSAVADQSLGALQRLLTQAQLGQQTAEAQRAVAAEQAAAATAQATAASARADRLQAEIATIREHLDKTSSQQLAHEAERSALASQLERTIATTEQQASSLRQAQTAQAAAENRVLDVQRQLTVATEARVCLLLLVLLIIFLIVLCRIRLCML